MSKKDEDMQKAAELSEQIDEYRQKKQDYKDKFSSLDIQLNSGLNLLNQLKEAQKDARENAANLDKSFKEKYADKLNDMDAKDKAITLREKAVTAAEEKARAKQNEAEKLLSDAFKTQKANDALKEKLTARHKKYESFLKTAKELLEEKD